MANFNYLKQENVTATAQVTHKEHGKQNLTSALYSYDKNISKIVIPVIVAGDKTLDFDTIKRVRILLTFNHDGLQKSIEDVAEIESKDNKTLYYIVTDKLKGYEGNVTMNIYLDLTTDQQIDLVEYGFSMKRSAIDQNIPEIEQFYFKSLDDVIVEMQQKSDQALKGMNDSLKVIEGNLTSVNYSVNSLAGKADDIQKQINDKEIVSNTQLQHYLAGKEIVVTYTCDLKNKVSGSVVENPHKIIGDRGTALPDPKTLPGDTSTAGYKKFAELDGDIVNVVATDKGEIMKIVEFFDLVTDINRRHPRLFESYGATTRDQQVIAAKKIVSSVTPVTYGYGSGANGNKLTMQIYNPRSKTWVGNSTHTEATTNKLNLAVDSYYLGDDGFVYTIVYAPTSDGVTPSIMNIDYVSLEYTLAIKMPDVYALSAKAQMSKVTEDTGEQIATASVDKPLLQTILEYGAGVRAISASSTTSDNPTNQALRGTALMNTSTSGNFVGMTEDGRLYARAISQGKWSGEWQTGTNITNQPLLFRSTIIKDQVWDTLKTAGIFYVSNATGAGRPLNASPYGYLTVTTSVPTVMHSYHDVDNQIYVRKYSPSADTWSDWQRLILESEFKDLAARVAELEGKVK